MQRFKKVLYCNLLKKEVSVTYFYEEVKGSDGLTKTKKVEFYNCEAQKECEDTYSVLDCSCFKEMKKVEYDINLNSEYGT
jgi:hypothetical protein